MRSQIWRVSAAVRDKHGEIRVDRPYVVILREPFKQAGRAVKLSVLQAPVPAQEAPAPPDPAPGRPAGPFDDLVRDGCGECLNQVEAVLTRYTGQAVKKLEDTIKGFQEIIDGKHDDLPEQAFYMVGTIDEVVEGARKMVAA